MLLLAGERGMGKTLLLSQAVRQAAVQEFRVVTGRCLPAGDGRPGPRPGAPLTSLLRTVADRCRKGGPEVVARLLGPRAGALATVEPTLRCGPWMDEAVPPPGGDVSLAAALVETVQALAAEQRLLLAIDDLQWADPLTLAFLAALAVDLGRQPLLVVGAYRPEGRDAGAGLRPLLAQRGVRTATLGPLSEEALTALVSDLLAIPRPPPALVKVMERRSRGNPARLIEALRAAAADGLLVRRRGRWVIKRQPRHAFWLRRTQQGL
jgi:eukaryotic-like serine/threonine-protein kinase